MVCVISLKDPLLHYFAIISFSDTKLDTQYNVTLPRIPGCLIIPNHICMYTVNHDI